MAASPKMVPTGASPEAFIAAVEHDGRREDAEALCALMTEWTGEPPVMWGAGIVGFGEYRYRYDSGREGSAPLAGFSPRKANLVVYLVSGAGERYPELFERLGPHRLGKGCLYLRRLEDVDREVLRELVDETVRWSQEQDRRARGES